MNIIFGCICITVFIFISTQSSHTTCTFKTLTVCVLSLYHKYCIRNASCTTVCITILQYLSLHTMHYFIRHHATVCATRVSSLVHHSHYSIICHHQTTQCKHQRFIISKQFQRPQDMITSYKGILPMLKARTMSNP